MRMTRLALLLLVAAALPAYAQRAPGGTTPVFVFATAAEGSAILGTRDDYVLATMPLERQAKLRTKEPVDDERFLKHMRGTTLEWTEEQRANLQKITDRLAGFLGGVKWRMPERMLLVQTKPDLEDDLPHTRANAIVFPASYYQRGPVTAAFVLTHEAFHVMTRHNPELKERLYAAIGFKRCETVSIPPAIARLRITNPDTVEDRHTIAVRYRGKPVEALPHIRLPSEQIDPREGFANRIQVAWLLIDRKGTDCRVREGAEASVDPNDLEGLFEQIGRNTQYLFHAEEVLADNFVELFAASLSSQPRKVPSPEILEKIRTIIFEP
jgi:hypothetical protein